MNRSADPPRSEHSMAASVTCCGEAPTHDPAVTRTPLVDRQRAAGRRRRRRDAAGLAVHDLGLRAASHPVTEPGGGRPRSLGGPGGIADRFARLLLGSLGGLA